jgi:HEPN domain-containing protein
VSIFTDKIGILKYRRQVIVTVILLVFFPLRAGAQDVAVQISVSTQQVDINSHLQLTVTVSGTMRSVPEPQVQNLEKFQVLSTSTSSQISIMNGRISTSKSFEYTLMPNTEGAIAIGPAVVEIKGRKYTSNTVTVEVTSGGAAPGKQPPAPGGAAPQPTPQPPARQPAPPAASSSGDRNLFISGNVDQKEVYLGEQVTYTFGFYNRLNLVENPEYNPPTFNSFWVEEMDKQARVSTRQVENIIYRVQELRYALFPTVEGEATISEAKLIYYVRNIWDFFDRGRKVVLTTRPVTVKVKPLPVSGRPANFSGAVGKYGVSYRLDKTAVKQGEAITLEYIVSGTGNIKTIGEPVLQGLDDFHIYESRSEEKIDRSGAKIKGKKIFKYVIVPRKAGDYGLPGIAFSYFDPELGKYGSIKTGEIAFTVQPSEEEQEAVTYRISPESVVAVGEDIRYIKENPKALNGAARPMSAGTVFWLVHFLPVLSVGGALLYRRHKGRLMSDTAYARLRGAGKRFEKNLKQASKAARSGDYAACYAALDRALNHFIGDKLNVETAGMLTENIDQLLDEKKLPEDIRDEVRECLEHFSFVRFAPQTGADAETAKRYHKKVRKLVSHLDRAL